MKEKIFNLIKGNKKIVIGVISITIVIITLLLFVNLGTFALDPDADTLTITCPDTASVGEVIECTIALKSMTINTQGISANYSVSEGMEFISFTKNNNWSNYIEGSPDGFVLVDFNGVSGSNMIGSLKYKLPETAKSNEKYKVELVNATIGDGKNISIAFEDVYSETRILSDINTLSSINVTNGTLDQTFNPNVNVYTTTINSDKVTIGANVTDENSVVSGDIGELSLHYGTNEFNIIVTSESGKDNTYVLKVYRPYEFSTDNYIYNSTENYIYTGTNVDNTTILSNIVLPSELTASIENSKLNIKYGNEKILAIDIVNITSNKFIISEDIMYIESNLTYDNFINTITLNGVTAKVFDTNGNEITSGIISGNYKLKIYYKNYLLDEYTLDEEYFSIDNLNIDENNKIIKDIRANNTYDSIISNITTTGSVIVKDKNGNIISNSSKVKTGDVIEIELTNATYKYSISVLGDINGDGLVNINDIVQLSKHVVKGNIINDIIHKYSADVDSNGVININDVIKLSKHIVNNSDL